MTVTVADAIDRLEQLLAAQPDNHRRQQAIYQAGRLRRALAASHQEGVRFAAFTLGKIVQDAAASWSPEVAATTREIRDGLEAAGVKLHH